jgi:YgiT-type zinc finger domain-containing protein
MSRKKNPSELCGLCEVGNAQLVLRPQKIKVKNEYFTVENIPMHECDHCGGRYFSRDVAMTLEQIRLKLMESGKPEKFKIEFIDRELAA